MNDAINVAVVALPTYRIVEEVVKCINDRRESDPTKI